MEESRTALPVHLQERMAQRQADIQSKKLQDSKVEGYTEDTPLHFWSEYHMLQEGIENQLSGLSDVPLADRPNAFNAVLNLHQQAEGLLTNAMDFLAPYDIRKAQSDLIAMKDTIDSKKAFLLPQKKFAFRGRVPRAKKSEQPLPVQPIASPELNPTQPAYMPLFDSHAIVLLDIKDQSLTRSTATCVGNRDVVLCNLTNCTVYITGRVDAVRADNLKNCKVIIGPVEGSVLIHDTFDCIFYLACRQLRVHRTLSCDFYLIISSHPIIEDCSKIRVSPVLEEWKIFK
eukprot:Ihof_evm5s44 gene=Ihof_evmTU5s44